ncbi:FecR domain-containing protein [Galbibacter sp. EGI 63066]|uniref:FecR family protein n=1 Tax=Galbibacter sp. EGI 63066 TaxID=2993559 RepID=UPI002248C42C|nr:FecR family protein [Galbibacter sp. EGI 63066]MCX2682051.1 FecR domain-containing protein [Galbibacter sp. EGI 63066]
MKEKINDYLKSLWKADYPVSETKEEIESSWERFSAKAFGEDTSKIIPMNKPRRQANIMKYAAVAAVLLIFVSLPFILNTETEFLLVENNSSNVREFTLPDNSKVSLQPEAKLFYAKDFKKHRATKIEGEAFFEVEKDKHSPFTVVCKKTTTSVLGTSFTVNSLFDEGVEVSLYEGSIKMEIEGGTQDWILAPGEQFVYNQQGTEVKSFDKNNNPTKSYIDFENARLIEIINYVQKTYGYTITANPMLLNESVTLRISKNESLENLINTIATIYNLDPEINNTKKEITLYQD